MSRNCVYNLTRLEVIIFITGISFLKSCYIENFDNNRQHYHFKNESIAIRHEIVWDNVLGITL